MTRKFAEDLDNEQNALPEGWYNVEVLDTRTIETNGKMAFIDWKVLDGPDKDRVTSTSLYVPEDHESGAVFHFRKKVAAFGQQLKDVVAGQPADDEFVGAFAEAIIGARCEAQLGVQKDGDYAGSQELLRTRPLNGGEGATQAPQAPAAEEAPAAAEPASDDVPF